MASSGTPDSGEDNTSPNLASARKDRRCTFEFNVDELGYGLEDATEATMIVTVAQLDRWVRKDPRAVLDTLSQMRLQIAEDELGFKEINATYTNQVAKLEVELNNAYTTADLA